MVRALDRDQTTLKSKSFHVKRMFDHSGKHSQSSVHENGNDSSGADEKSHSRNHPKQDTPLNLPRSDKSGAKIPNPHNKGPTGENYSMNLQLYNV